jgi:thiol-disulfide isomerase/thioredoxin
MRTGRALLVAACIGFLTSVATADELPAPAPAFTLKTFDGKWVRLSELKGRPVVLDFWATWCRPCRASMPHLDELQKRYGSQGLVVIGLSVDEGSQAEVRRFAQSLGVTFRLGMANDHVLDDYGPIRFVPTTFFIDRTGRMVRRVRGYLDAETLEGYTVELFSSSSGSAPAATR